MLTYQKLLATHFPSTLVIHCLSHPLSLVSIFCSLNLGDPKIGRQHHPFCNVHWPWLATNIWFNFEEFCSMTTPSKNIKSWSVPNAPVVTPYGRSRAWAFLLQKSWRWWDWWQGPSGVRCCWWLTCKPSNKEARCLRLTHANPKMVGDHQVLWKGASKDFLSAKPQGCQGGIYVPPKKLFHKNPAFFLGGCKQSGIAWITDLLGIHSTDKNGWVPLAWRFQCKHGWSPMACFTCRCRIQKIRACGSPAVIHTMFFLKLWEGGLVRHVSASSSWPLRCEGRCERGVRYCFV